VPDSQRGYEAFLKLVQSLRTAIAPGPLGLLLAVLGVSGWKVLATWRQGSLNAVETLSLLIALLAGEAAAARHARDLSGAPFALLLLVPLAVWAGTILIAQVAAREQYLSATYADMERFRAALRRDPRNVAAYVFLGDAYVKLGRPRQAGVQYRLALSVDPVNYEARYKLAKLARA
jgi:tetratricopeptide (TPR) repeat protein